MGGDYTGGDPLPVRGSGEWLEPHNEYPSLGSDTGNMSPLGCLEGWWN